MIRRLMAHRVYDPVIRESAPLRYPFAADDAAIAFGDERAARVWLEGARWPDGPGCPRCATPSRRGAADPDGRHWCGSCRRRFNVRTGTALERRRAPLRAWAAGVALSTNGPFVVRPEALRETCGITTGASRDVADGLRAACGGIVCPYDRPERLAGRVLGILRQGDRSGDGSPPGRPPNDSGWPPGAGGLPSGQAAPSEAGGGLVGDWWRRLDDGLPARPAGRDRWLTPPRPVWELAVAPPPHPRPDITESEVLVLAVLHTYLDGADSAVLAETAGITRRHSQRVLAGLACDGYVASAVRTIPWRHRTRQVRIWSLTERANALSPYLPRLRHARRAVSPERLPADLWHLFWSGPDPADIRLPRDALLVANRLLNGRFLDPDAKRWALRHLPLDALRAQTGIPGCGPDVERAVQELTAAHRG